MRSILAQGKSVSDVRINLASSKEFTTNVTNDYQGTYHEVPAQVTLGIVQALVDTSVPYTDARSMLLSQTGIFSSNGIETPDGTYLMPAAFPAGMVPLFGFTGIDAHIALSHTLHAVDPTWKTNTTFGGLFGDDRPDVLHENPATGTLAHLIHGMAGTRLAGVA